MELPLPPWAIALMALTVPPAIISVIAFILNRTLGVVGTDKASAVLSELLSAIADGSVSEDEVQGIIDAARARETKK